MNANLFFFTLNNAWTMALTFVVIIAAIYLIEVVREDGWREVWSRLHNVSRPTAEQLAVAILITDLGNWMVRGSTAVWRKSGGGLGALEGFVMWTILIGAFLGAAGILCKVRVISLPRFGHWPWLACSIAMVAVAAATVMVY